MKTTIDDPQLGQIELRRFRAARVIRLKIRQDGSLYVTMPSLTPLSLARKFINQNLDELLRAQADSQKTTSVKYHDQQKVGSSHKIILNHQADELKAYSVGQVIRWLVPPTTDPDSQKAQDALRPIVRKVLDRQAKSYPPRRLRSLADKHGFSFDKTRFGNAKGRWGSCSSNGTITLNVALMNLPLDTIDYVLIHELCHTQQMNHSRQFWDLVETCLPDYKLHRKNLKSYSPYL